MMKGIRAAAAALGVVFASQAWSQTAPAKDTSLYPNDFGALEIDVSEYPKQHREAYRMMTFKCAACHTPARAINAQFLELTEEEEKKAKAEDPELFKDDKIVKVEEKIWSRMVKRMMAKPGAPIKMDEAKKIYEFLVFDAKTRKMGEKGKEFRKDRAKLVDDFKKKYPDAYKQVFVDAEKAAGKTGK